MGILLLALLATGLTVWMLRSDTALPPGAEQGLPPHTIAASRLAPATATSMPEAGRRFAHEATTDSAPVRIEVASASSLDRQVCMLQVTVQTRQLPGVAGQGMADQGMTDQGMTDQGGSAGASERRAAAAFVDVSVTLPELGIAGMIARTDANGVAEFAFFGGDGMTVQASACIGGKGMATLAAEQLVALSIAAEPRVLATGRVIDASNVGIADADILVLRWASEDGGIGELCRVGRSNRDGSFHVPLAIGGRIGASHPDYATSPMFLLRPNRNSANPSGPTNIREQVPTQVFELLLRNTAASIAGIVRDADGKPVAGAQIEVRSSTAAPREAELVGPPARVLSDIDGCFAIFNMQPGEVHWFARADQHGWIDGHANLNASQSNTLAIQLPRPATLSGVVVDGATQLPVAGASVRVGQPGTVCYRATTSDADGNFQFTDLGSGPIEVAAKLAQRSAKTRLQLSPDNPATWRAELANHSSAMQLTGTLVDERDQPLPGWLLVVRQTGRDPVQKTSDDNGRFAIAVQQAQQLDVRVFAPGRSPTSFADHREPDVSIAQPLKLVVPRQATTTLRGRVVVSNAAGVPATIGCWHDERHEYARYAADGNGQFVITHAPVGTVYLTIEHPGHVTFESGGLQLLPAADLDLGIIALHRGGGLYGTVRGPTGVAPANCELKLLSGLNQQPVHAEYVDGSYRFVDVPAGPHTLLVQGEQLAPASFPITITAGSDLPRDIELLQGLHRQVRVAVPADGGTKLKLMMRTTDGLTRWLATGNVLRDGPNQQGYALFETWMPSGTFEVLAATNAGYQSSTTITYDSLEGPVFVLQVAPR